MFHSGTKSRVLGAALAALALIALVPAPASAQGLFEALFGALARRPSGPPPVASSYADPSRTYDEPRRSYSGSAEGGGWSGGGGGTAFCVRTCDGRFFPLQRVAGASPAELCKSFCPAAKTAVFYGGKIDYATASNGTRYADLDAAFVYREKIVDNCTCNGRDAFGLARLAAVEDPTLRPGDIVATKDGLMSYRGGRGSKAAEFTPISAISGEWGKRLAAIQVRAVPEPEKVTPVADDPAPRKNRRTAQRTNQRYSR